MINVCILTCYIISPKRCYYKYFIILIYLSFEKNITPLKQCYFDKWSWFMIGKRLGLGILI